MSYGMTAVLQQAVFSRLRDDPTVSSLSDGAIYDALPRGPVPDLFLSLGPERARDRSDITGRGAIHDFAVSVISDGAGFQGAKALAAAVSDALSEAELVMARGRLVSLRFLRARARRLRDRREIEIWFRARLDESVA